MTEIGEDIKLTVEARTTGGVLEDATTMTISIWKPDGTLDIDAVAMTHDDTGKYSYWYRVSDQVGTHNILYLDTTSGHLTKQRDSFEAVSELHT